jgi:opacity protein-like surface antigen
MRRLLIALGLAGLASQALAADLPVLRPSTPYVRAYPTYFRWQEFYVGGQLTGGDAHADFTHSTQQPLALQFRELALQSQVMPSNWQVLGAADASHAGFGAYTGYNLQFDNAILGWDVSYTYSALNVQAPNYPIGRNTGTLSNGHAYNVFLTGSGSMQMHDFATVRGRFGWAVDNVMPYATLGLAVGRADINFSVTCSCQELMTNPGPPPAQIVDADFSFTSTQSKNSAFLFGYAGGAGLEVAFTQNLIGRIEYEYIQWVPVFQITSHLNMGRIGLGYRF